MMKMLMARLHPRRIVLTVHLDTTRVIEAEPDGAWVLTQEYPLGQTHERQPGETPAQHAERVAEVIANVIDDMKHRCKARLAELDDIFSTGLALPEEGQAL